MTPHRVGRSPRCSPTANATVSNPNTTKFTCCTQPPGLASSALTTSATGLYSSSRNNPCATKATVNSIGPTMPAAASAAITERRCRTPSPAGSRLRCSLICSSFRLEPHASPDERGEILGLSSCQRLPRIQLLVRSSVSRARARLPRGCYDDTRAEPAGRGFVPREQFGGWFLLALG